MPRWVFSWQVKQGSYNIYTISHLSLYQRIVNLFKHEKCHIFTSELCYPVKSFDEKFYICETSQKYLYKNEMPCQAVYNKMALHPIPDELKDFEKIRKTLNF